MLDPLSFAHAEPCGRLMRYQMRQSPSMLKRWASHVDGWLDAAAEFPRIVIVRYEDLDANYERTVRSFEPYLERPPQQIVRPAREHQSTFPGHIAPAMSETSLDTAALDELCRQQVGPTLARLGYE